MEHKIQLSEYSIINQNGVTYEDAAGYGLLNENGETDSLQDNAYSWKNMNGVSEDERKRYSWMKLNM